MKRGESLSLNVIIIAALVLIVLVILVVIFTGKIGGFGKGVSACSGTCAASAEACTKNGDTPIYIINCDDDGDGKADPEGNYCCTQSS